VSPIHVQQIALSAGLLPLLFGSYMLCLLAVLACWVCQLFLLVLEVTIVDACLSRASVFFWDGGRAWVHTALDCSRLHSEAAETSQ
jgi:hypothetical protein